MGARTRRNRGGGKGTAADRSERHVKRKCTIYCQRILQRYPRIDSATLSFLTWILDGEMEGLCQFLLAHAQGEPREAFREALRECQFDPDDYPGAITRLLSHQPKGLTRKLHRYLLQALEQRIVRFPDTGLSETARVLKRLRQLFGLTAKEAELCFLIFISSGWPAAEDYFDCHLQWHRPAGRKYLLAALQLKGDELNRILHGTIKTIGMLDKNWFHCLSIEEEYQPFFLDTGIDLTSQGLFKAVQQETLPLAYHLVEPAVTAHMLRLLAHRPEMSSTHLLLYGPAGTGKSSYARGLAKDLDIPAFEISKKVDQNTELQRAAILACLNLTNHGAGSLVIVDEADTLLNTESSWTLRGESQDKGWLNQLLEKPGVRMIWITNHIQGIEASVRRRFAYSLLFRSLGKQKRVQLWERIRRRNRACRLLSAEAIRALADKYKVTPGAIDMAVRKAKEMQIDQPEPFLAAVQRSLDAYWTLLHDGLYKEGTEQMEEGFTLDGLNLHGDLGGLLGQLDTYDQFLRRHDDQRHLSFNLLLYGPPGSGKSELARYFAHRLDRELVVRRASDLFGPFVGQTEQLLAQAFTEAESEEAILVIDEVDTFLFSRDRAVHTWETSCVNEFLMQMERFRGILVCTTNRLRDLDPAAVRRFTNKLLIDLLGPEGNVIFYEKLLAALVPAPLDDRSRQAIAALVQLAPGDFKVVRDRFALRPRAQNTHEELIAALADEARFKEQQQGKITVGFNHNRRR